VEIVAVFKDKALDVPLPRQLILTRLGTWIRTVVYYYEHLEVFKSIIDSMDEEDTVSIANSQKYFSDISLTVNLIFIESHFGFLPDLITSLEAKHIPLYHAI